MTLFSSRTIVLLLLAVSVGTRAFAGPPARSSAAFDDYIRRVETRLAQQHSSQAGFLAGGLSPETRRRLQQQELVIERVAGKSEEQLPGALVHHWRGTAFAPGATAADFERLLRNVNAFPRVYAPQVLSATAREQQPDSLLATMRVRQKHVVTVVLDVTYQDAIRDLDATHGYSLSHSTEIKEIAAAGTAAEHALPPGEDHGFMWRLNTYWSFEEADGGLYLQIESVSLTRSIPAGLGWVVTPFTDSIPRESLEFTLASTRNALRK